MTPPTQNGRFLRKALPILPLASLCLPLLTASAMLANPDFTDSDGDGIPDGWELKTYILEDFKGIRCLSMKFPRDSKSPLEGEASTMFEGPEGFYQVRISYLDEFDGVSKAKLLVNGEVRWIWNFDNTFGDVWREEVIENVELKPGDRITFRGRDNPSEYCRIRSIRVDPSPNPPTAIELEERRNPPDIAEKDYGPLVALRDVRDLSSYKRRPEYRPLLSDRGSPLLVLKKAGEEAELKVAIYRPKNPRYKVTYHGAAATGRDQTATPVAEGDLPFDEIDSSATISLPVHEEGLFEVRGPTGYVTGDPPHVLLAQAAAGEKNRGEATGGFYFFVPRGTTAFGIGAHCMGDYIAEVTIYAPDGSLVTQMDVPKGSPQGIPIRVREGQDDAIWALNVSGVAPVIRLSGIPPYLATHPRHLLVPAECVAEKK